MDQRDARARLEAMHAERALAVAPFLTPDEPVVDTGPTRIESGLGRARPGPREDTDGQIVLTDRRILIRDRFGRLSIPYASIADWTIKPAGRFGAAKMTALITVTDTDGDVFTLSQGRDFTQAMNNVLATYKRHPHPPTVA